MQQNEIIKRPVLWACLVIILSYFALGYLRFGGTFQSAQLTATQLMNTSNLFAKIGQGRMFMPELLNFTWAIPLSGMVMMILGITNRRKALKVFQWVALGIIVFYIVYFQFLVFSDLGESVDDVGFGAGIGLWFTLGAMIVILLEDNILKWLHNYQMKNKPRQPVQGQQGGWPQQGPGGQQQGGWQQQGPQQGQQQGGWQQQGPQQGQQQGNWQQQGPQQGQQQGGWQQHGPPQGQQGNWQQAPQQQPPQQGGWQQPPQQGQQGEWPQQPPQQGQQGEWPQQPPQQGQQGEWQQQPPQQGQPGEWPQQSPQQQPPQQGPQDSWRQQGGTGPDSQNPESPQSPKKDVPPTN